MIDARNREPEPGDGSELDTRVMSHIQMSIRNCYCYDLASLDDSGLVPGALVIDSYEPDRLGVIIAVDANSDVYTVAWSRQSSYRYRDILVSRSMLVPLQEFDCEILTRRSQQMVGLEKKDRR